MFVTRFKFYFISVNKIMLIYMNVGIGKCVFVLVTFVLGKIDGIGVVVIFCFYCKICVYNRV